MSIGELSVGENKVSSRAAAQSLRGFLAEHDSSTHWLGAAIMFLILTGCTGASMNKIRSET